MKRKGYELYHSMRTDTKELIFDINDRIKVIKTEQEEGFKNQERILRNRIEERLLET